MDIRTLLGFIIKITQVILVRVFTIIQNSPKLKACKLFSGNLYVRTPNSSDRAANFRYFSAPVIKSFTPASAHDGDVITISGKHFMSALLVKFANMNGGILLSSQ